jgi:hypothetical protein
VLESNEAEFLTRTSQAILVCCLRHAGVSAYGLFDGRGRICPLPSVPQAETGATVHVVTRLMRHADSRVKLEHYAHIVGDAERVATEKFSQRIGLNIDQLESDSELESTSAVKTA